MRFYKNLIAAYLCLVFCFSYTTLLAAIPNHIYLTEDEEPEFHLSVPVSFSASDQDTGSATTAGSAAKSTSSGGYLVPQRAADYIMVCRFLGIFPIKEVEVSVISPQSVYASGRVIGIYEQTSGVLVLKTDSVSDASGVAVSPSENRVLSGDYICGVNGAAVTTKEELIDAVQENGENRLTLTLVRKGGQIDVAVDPVCSADGQYMLGIWVKDDMAGIGTMTYYTTSGSFGALGHGIGDGETGNLLEVSSGSIFNMRLMGIEKGQTGTPGELKGIIYYGNDNYLGSVAENDEMGIYGTLGDTCLREYRMEDDCFEIGYMQDIETESAYILSDISGEVKSYEIVIDSVNYQAADTNKGILFHVTDSDLLDLTGGIVQGMSGSPIIQNGKLIGAVTHVLVNDPAKGYGIFIETMLEHDN
jgi:stage IV sporulation protein B